MGRRRDSHSVRLTVWRGNSSVTGTRPLRSENAGAGYSGRVQRSPGPKLSSGENDRQSQLAEVREMGTLGLIVG